MVLSCCQGWEKPSGLPQGQPAQLGPRAKTSSHATPHTPHTLHTTVRTAHTTHHTFLRQHIHTQHTPHSHIYTHTRLIPHTEHTLTHITHTTYTSHSTCHIPYSHTHTHSALHTDITWKENTDTPHTPYSHSHSHTTHHTHFYTHSQFTKCMSQCCIYEREKFFLYTENRMNIFKTCCFQLLNLCSIFSLKLSFSALSSPFS